MRMGTENTGECTLGHSRPVRAPGAGKERGAGTLEYIGVAVTAALIIAALLMVPMGPKMADGVRSIICGISSHSPWGDGGDCGGNDPNTPPRCMVASNENSRESGLGASVRVPKVPILKFSGEIGDGVAVVLEETSDGDYTVSVVDTRYGGLGAEVGGDIEDVVALKAGVSARLQAGEGFQETFSSQEEAMAYYEATYDHFDSGWNLVPGSTLARSFPTLDDSPPQREFSTFELELTGEAQASIERPSLVGGDEEESSDGDGGAQGGDGQGSQDEPGGVELDTDLVEIPSSWVPSAGLEGSLSGEVQYMVDRGENMEDPSDTTYHYTMGYEMGGSFDVTAGSIAEWVTEMDLSHDAERSRSGMYTVITDHQGEVVGVEFETISYVGSNGDGVAEVSTLTMDIETEAQRRAFEDWTRDPLSSWPDPTLEELPAAGSSDAPRSEFEQMVYDQGTAGRNTYAVETGSDNGFWENAAGWLPWYDASREYTNMELVDSQWAPPTQGAGASRTFETNEGCVA